MKKKILLYCFVVLISNLSFSQAYEDEDIPVKPAKEKLKISERLVFGGNLGLNFGTETYVNISPLIGYKVTDRLTTGFGISYTYISQQYYNYKGHAFGGSVFTEFAVIKNISELIPLNMNFGLSIYGEYNFLNVRYLHLMDNFDWINSPMLGLALKIPISYRSYVRVMFLYNFNDNLYSPYQNPVIMFNFNF